MDIGGSPHNLPAAQRHAKKSLQTNRHIVINPLDLVIMNKQVPLAFVQQSAIKFKNILAQAFQQGLIDTNTLRFLDIPNPRTTTFYALPKI